MRIFLFLGVLFFGFQQLAAQTNCTGAAVLTEKKCAGDEISLPEKELHRIVNEYRAQFNLPPVAISDSLSFVANRHLLDLVYNVKYLTHGWSNCPYDIKNESSWNCLFESPQRLGANYAGHGFENLYRNMGGNATPALALEAWKKSPMHNNLILNIDIWKDTRYDAFGVAISGNYAAIWFGSRAEPQVNLGREIKGLGISFEKVVNGLTNFLSIQKESSLAGSEKWVGSSADKSILLEIYGQEKDISETTMSLSVKLSKGTQLSPQSRAALAQFLKNVAEKWSDRQKWMDTALVKLGKTPKAPQTVRFGDKTIEVRINAANYLTVLVKPVIRPAAKEL